MIHIFISHAHSDKIVAELLKGLFSSIFGEANVKVEFSSDESPGEGISPGANWYNWILDQVKSCDMALLVITPSSVNKPWLLWEAGAVQGVALAENKSNNLLPVVFGLSKSQIPSPFKNIQTTDGAEFNDVQKLIGEIADRAANKKGIHKRLIVAESKIREYLLKLNDTLLHLPMTITEQTVEEWRQRISDMLKSNRGSEIGVIERWLRVAYGFEESEQTKPIDLRLHRMLGDAFLSNRAFDKAILHLNNAMTLSPRDIFIMRSLAQAHIELGQFERARGVMDKITALDPNAFSDNPECAGLKGRWHKKKYEKSENSADLKKARDAYAAGLAQNAKSYYLADNVAQLSLLLDDEEQAIEAFTTALNALRTLKEQNIWSLATRANAEYFLGKQSEAKKSLAGVMVFNPGLRELEAIEGGLRKTHLFLRKKEKSSDEALHELMDQLGSE